MPRYTKPRRTWAYDHEFKARAVQLSYVDGLSVTEVANSLDIHPYVLSRWCTNTFHELAKHGMKPSVNRAGYCTDNAHMESFFHTLKAELIRGNVFINLKQLRYALSGYINHFYNRKRLHSGIGYYTPAEYERIVA